ncbi:hypothetical protein B0T18DRAFT_425429 [Schizothecium vesticola]|uniref:Uncharacterized protein n=1 Tax=Schizothecium vesticola TaxID=314040 RepID=A0AA40FCB6_9PEZI|nr:hypothetical protein B0T18DRAFT_425429 [Schizothecium vesticola]
MAPNSYAAADSEDLDTSWTSDTHTRDEKLKILLQGKQGDAENAKILIDLLESGVLGADSSGDSDSEDDGPDLAAVPVLSSPGAFEDDDDFLATPAAGLETSGFDDRVAIDFPYARGPVNEFGEWRFEEWTATARFQKDHDISDPGFPTRPAVQQAPPTVYELVSVPQLRFERAAGVQTETLRASAGATVEREAASLEEDESEVRELEKQLQEKKARLEEMRRKKAKLDEMRRERRERVDSGSEIGHKHDVQSLMAVEPATGVAVAAAHRRRLFSRAKSRFRRLFSWTGAGSTEKGLDRDLLATSNTQNKPSNTLFVVSNDLPPPDGTQDASPSPPPASKKRTPPLPPPKVSDSETLLRTKIFAPHTLALMTALPEPVWTSPPNAATTACLFSLTATPLTRHTLLPQGQFVAQRQRDVTDALSKIELGLGATLPGGVGVNATSTGLLALLKPYQWINMWRGVEREMYVASSSPSTRGPGKDSKGDVDVDMDALHALENELMSPAKYLFGESEYLTVVTHSSDVNSGAVSLFRASLGGPDGGLVTALTLEARFKDMPREICRILRRGVKPNRYELRRSGRALSCRERGGEGVLPPCLAVVRRDGEAKDGGLEEGWVSIGGGWRRALRIVLGEGDAGTGPREGLVATVPQMLAFLHLTHRVVDYVPSTPVFSFDPPLMGMADDGACRVRRGTKLLGQPGGAVHVGESVTISVLFSRDSRWVREQLLWA